GMFLRDSRPHASSSASEVRVEAARKSVASLGDALALHGNHGAITLKIQAITQRADPLKGGPIPAAKPSWPLQIGLCFVSLAIKCAFSIAGVVAAAVVLLPFAFLGSALLA